MNPTSLKSLRILWGSKWGSDAGFHIAYEYEHILQSFGCRSIQY